jgi:hypothetical protein
VYVYAEFVYGSKSFIHTNKRVRLAQPMQPDPSKKTPLEVSYHVGYRDGRRWVSNRSAP